MTPSFFIVENAEWTEFVAKGVAIKSGLIR